LQFHPRELGTQAEVRPVTESQVRVRVAGEVEFGGVGEDLLVEVGRAAGAQYRLAGPHHHLAEPDVGGGDPRVDGVAEHDEPQHFLHRAGQQFGPRLELAQLRAVCQQHVHHVGDSLALISVYE
jgi:hypothetical protein